ncbi:tryptophan-rich sensory protein [bacterium]|nr:tryptophan-rich sensory protein [bacterium]
MVKVIKFLFAMFLGFLPGIIGVMFTPRGMSDAWYNAMAKSVLTPDGWVFGVAWTLLYAMLGIALYLVMRRPRPKGAKVKPYSLFVIQMILNALWTYLFFGMHMMTAAFAVVVALVLVSIWMMRSFRPISRGASYLIWPYILWGIFAAYLNGMILYLN